MTTETTIPLNLLVQSKANVRRTGRTDGIAELAASIAAHGLRQNLNVQPITGGRYEVVAGARRLRALKLLAKEGRLAKDAPVSCLVLDASDDPAEISLAENSLRLAMHPDDQCDAFRALIEDKGMGVEDVAARFGITAAVVRQRLKLANVAPALRALYRKGAMTLDHVMALAISDDHAAQQEAWDNLPEWNREPHLLKQALTHEAVPLTDKLARFVGVETYVAAGGTVLRDLFDAEDEGYLPDRALVQRLASAKLAEAVDAVRGEGWKWVIPETTRDYDTRYGRVYPQPVEGEDAVAYTPEDAARAGARVILEHDGTLRIERGLVHPDDMPAEGKAAGDASRPKASPAELPATMVEELTAHRTAALRIELARNPAVALAATVHAMTLASVYGAGLAGSCLAVRASSEALGNHLQAPGDSPAHQAMADEGDRWGDRLPGNPGDLWAWCLVQPQDVLLDLLAYATALTVNAVQAKHDHPQGDRLTHADQLADALRLDMRQWWTPTVASYFGRVSKARMLEAVAEAVSRGAADNLVKLKKDALAIRAEEKVSGTGWLPPILRPVSPASELSVSDTDIGPEVEIAQAA
jgi:ParB family transcriptional regulator, chromosome partitioning protein